MSQIHVRAALRQENRLLSWGIHFFLTAALTAAQPPGGYAPFALGCIAAAGPGAAGYAALAGGVAGAALFMEFAQALPFLAVGILIVTAASALRGPWMERHPKAPAAIAVGLFLTVEMLYVFQALSPLVRLGNCVTAAGLLGASAWLFRPVLESGAERAADGLVYMGSVLLLAAADLEVIGLSPCRGVLCVLLAWSAYGRGPSGGAALGLGVGLTADLCGGTAGVYTAAFGLAGLLCGSCYRRWRWCAALAFLGGIAAASLPGRNVGLVVETAAGMSVFLLLPGRVFGGKRVRRPSQEERDREAGQQWKIQLSRAAGALRDLYDSLGRGAPQPADENPAVVFDRAAEKVCRNCALCELCWQREYGGTFNALNDATPHLLNRGRALAKDFPTYFTSRCIHLQDLLSAIDAELSAFLLRKQYRRQLEETRRSARGQYAQLSELLTATAASLGAAVPASGTNNQTDCRIGAVLRPKEGESVCGDTLMSFQTEQGTWCLLLADGMGSGEAARKESALTCRLLRQFLEAGIAPDAALKTLNSAMALRGADTGSFTTIDLCVYDPRTSEASFYKFGAAPSYLKKGGTVRRITGGSLPAGLRGASAAPDITRTPLEPGAFAIMISDGAADPNEDDWLQTLLAAWTGDDPQALATQILTESARHEHMRDDCAVQILHRPVGAVPC